MKMKSLFTVCALAALPAFATDVSSSNTFGAMKVTCNAGKVMICTPWVECLTGDAVKVTDLLMTTGLASGDSIVVYAGGSFKGWSWSGTAWTPTAVSGVGGTVSSGAAADAPIARGNGFWFVKNGYTSGSYDLYLYGQVTSAAATSTINAGAYNLLANPNAAAFDIKGKINGAANGDSIQLSSGATYRFDGTNWTTQQKVELGNPGSGVFKVKDVAVDSISIPAGEGFWYVSKGGSNGTIAWQ